MPWQPSYVTGAALRAYVERASGVTLAEPPVGEDATYFDRLAAAASRVVDEHCGRNGSRQFGQVDEPEARTYTSGARRVSIDDLMTTTGLVVDVDGTPYVEPVAGWASLLWPANAPQRGRPWERLTLGTCHIGSVVTVIGRWGWSSIPDGVVTATLLQGHRLHIRRDSPYGVAGTFAEGSEMRLLARVDPDVKVALAPYRKAGRPL